MQNYETVAQVALLLATGAAVHISLSPPNPSVKIEDCCSGTKGTETLFERVVQSITYCSKSMVWLGAALNILAIVIRSFWPHTTRQEATAWVDTMSPEFISVQSRVHPMLVIGAVFTVSAALLRVWCFKTLGPLFTFEITIRPEHRLVVQGPYAWVRHPSYTGVYFTLTGATLALASPGNWTTAVGIWTPLGTFAVFVWVAKCLFAFRGMIVRHGAEDEVLHATFGAEWEIYAACVPYKFIPGVL